MDDQSDLESVQSFHVEDPSRKKDDPADQWGLTPGKLDWVANVFGDTSVLKPLGEMEAGDEDAPPAVHASLGAAEASAAASMAAKQETPEVDASQPAVLPLCDSLDPDVLEKSYQLPVDQAFAASQEPERWLQTYCVARGQPDKLRSWTDEEYQNEARWCYNQAFRSRGYSREITESAIVRVLSKLHDQKLELIYIVEHLWWMVAKALTKEDLWLIQEYDYLWQPHWKRYLLLLEWTQALEQTTTVPDHIKQKVQRDVASSDWKTSLAWSTGFLKLAAKPEAPSLLEKWKPCTWISYVCFLQTLCIIRVLLFFHQNWLAASACTFGDTASWFWSWPFLYPAQWSWAARHFLREWSMYQCFHCTLRTSLLATSISPVKHLITKAYSHSELTDTFGTWHRANSYEHNYFNLHPHIRSP